MSKLAYQKISTLNREMHHRHLNNPYYYEDKDFLSNGWNCLYKDMLDYINKSDNVDFIDICRFVARYSIRKIQELGLSKYRNIVEYHYWKVEIERKTKLIANDPEIVNLALRIKLDNPGDYTKQLRRYSEIILEELSKIGYDKSDPRVELYGNTANYGKWLLDKNVKDAYNNLSIWESIPATGAKEQTLLEECFISMSDSSDNIWYKVKGQKGKYKIVRFVIPA